MAAASRPPASPPAPASARRSGCNAPGRPGGVAGGGSRGGGPGDGGPGGGGPGDGGSLVGGQVFVLDRVRIEVALEARQRYRYVRPRVLREGPGWKVVSPNCSRNIDPAGGDIDIAWLVPAPSSRPGQPGAWRLHARDHAAGGWVLKLHAATLAEALQRLVQDEQREFWQ